MSIFDRAMSENTRTYVYDTIMPPQIQLDQREIERVSRLDRNIKWELKLTLIQSYWANKVQQPQMERIAMAALSQFLYQDILSELPHLRLQIQSGDKVGAMNTIDRIEGVTRP